MKFKFIGGSLALDFINTVGDHLSPKGSEYLKSYEDLLAWSVAAEAFSESEKEQVSKLAGAQPAKAAQTLKKAIKLRETLFRMLLAVIAKDAPAPALIAEFNDYLDDALKHLQLEQTGGSFSFSWKNPKDDLEQLTRVITWSAANLLIDADLKLLKVCADNSCGWLFLDTSKNKRRAWCDMKDCGNRNKFRRFYSKNKEQ